MFHDAGGRSPHSASAKLLGAHHLPGTHRQRRQHDAIARPQRRRLAAAITVDDQRTQQRDTGPAHDRSVRSASLPVNSTDNGLIPRRHPADNVRRDKLEVRSTERPFAEEEEMSTRKTPRWRRVPIQFAVVAAVATGTAGAIAGAAIANDDDDRASEVVAADDAVDADRTEAVPGLITAREQRRLRQIVAKMPAGWPATEVMRRAAEQPLGDAVARERWSRDAERCRRAGPPPRSCAGRAEDGG